MTRSFTTRLRLRLRAAGRAIGKLLSRPADPPSREYFRFPPF